MEIIQKEALEIEELQKKQKTTGVSSGNFVVQQKIQREVDETDEEFQKRLKKINFLSLAQEFAELKKVDADALPFDLHKSVHEDFSPMSDVSMSETESSDRALTDSAAATPMDAGKEFPQEEVFPLQSRPTSVYYPPARPNSIRRASDSNDNIMDEVSQRMATTNLDGLPPTASTGAVCNNKDQVDSNSGKFRTDLDLGGIKDAPKSPCRKMDSSVISVEGDFDVYNIETTLPQMDWALLEQQLKKAAEEEELQKKVSAY